MGTRPYIEFQSQVVRGYHEVKLELDCDSFTAHRVRRQEVLIRATTEATTVEQLRQVLLEHLDPQVLKVPRG